MKYRGVELKLGDEYQSELCIGIEYDPEQLLGDEVLDLVHSKLNNFRKDYYYFESVLSNYILLRNHERFTFDEEGVNNLKEVYDLLNPISQIDVYIDINTDDWFESDGETYNSDSIDWEDFIENLEY